MESLRVIEKVRFELETFDTAFEAFRTAYPAYKLDERRASVEITTTLADVYRHIQFAERFFDKPLSTIFTPDD